MLRPALLTCFLLLPGASDDLPPDLGDISGTSCLAKSVENYIDKDKQTTLKITYEAHATVTYLDKRRPDWNKEISVRDSMKEAAMDCVKWVEEVSKARKKRGKS